MAFTKQTYSEQVASHIKECILMGELAPGDQVKEVMLAERLGISRAPVREALHILMREGLICSKPQRGKFIRALTSKEVKDSYFIGGVLEGAAIAASLACFNEEDYEHFDKLLVRMRTAAKTATDILDFSELDNEFHNLLLSRCGNPQLTELTRRSCLNISKFLFYNHWSTLFTPQEFCRRHEAILEALKSKNPVRVEKVVRDHYRETGERMSQHAY